ncbi:hypothetical protein FACS1894169_15970 [Bacteroidia bacterium]|nr:hypothetical protein FACS1894169_15970 [Bacteroidia bacterium]
MGNKIAKIIIVILVIVVLAIIAFYAILVLSFFGGGDFYAPFVIIVFIAISIWLILFALRTFKRKVLWLVFLGIFLSSAIAVTIYEWRKYYVASIPTVDDQGVNLYEYQPFKEDSKIAKLSEDATFKIQGKTPSIDGATALYPLYAAFVQATFPEDEYLPYTSKVTSNTTPRAYNRLINGDADLIFCAAPSKSQVENAHSLGKEFRMTPIGKEAFVFFVNAKNPVSELSVEQIQSIYSGKITNWKDLGGENEDIKAFQRPKDSGSQTMLEKIMGDLPLMPPLLNDVVDEMGGIIEQTAEYKNFGNAIGYSFLFFATEMVGNNQIKLIKVNGIEPTRETIKSGTYPFVGDFYAITTDSENENLKGFIDWILSPQGQKLVEETGYTPLIDINFKLPAQPSPRDEGR